MNGRSPRIRYTLAGALLLGLRLGAQPAPLLSLQEAERLAGQGNPELQVQELELKRAKEQLAAARTRQYPNLQTYAVAGQLLTRPNVQIPEGAFGVFPGIGPIPETLTDLTTARRPIGFAFAQAAQPLTALVRIRMGLRIDELGIEIQQAKLRQQEQASAAHVRQLYYQIWQVQSELTASRAGLDLYKETVRLAHSQAKHEAVLPSEVSHAEAQFARQEAVVLKDEDEEARAREKLNLLLGRDVETEFRVEELDAKPDTADLNPPELRSAALAHRADLKTAQLSIEQANYAIRAKRAEYIPDLSLTVQYFNIVNVGFGIPRNYGAAGFLLQWEPWDWGRRRHEAQGLASQKAEASIQLTVTRNQALAEVNEVIRGMKEAAAFWKAAQLAADAAQEGLRERQSAFEKEAVLFRDVLDSQAQLATANAEVGKAMTGYLSAQAALKQAIGEE